MGARSNVGINCVIPSHPSHHSHRWCDTLLSEAQVEEALVRLDGVYSESFGYRQLSNIVEDIIIRDNDK